MSKHTPGPWEWFVNADGSVECLIGPEESEHGRGVGSPVIVRACIEEEEEFGDPIARLSVRERDRPLIAASPDLLAACEALVDGNCDAYQIAVAAIAKAKGAPQ